MLKNIVLVVVVGALGYLAAMVFPPPASWQAEVNNVISGAEKQLPDALPNNDESQAEGQQNANTDVNANEDDSQQQAESDRFVQQDLLFSPVKTSELSTLVLGTFGSEALANSAVEQLTLEGSGIADKAEQHLFTLPTGTDVVLVTIGQYESINEAVKAKQDIEAFHNVNLQLSKYPQKAPPPEDENAKVAESLIEVLQSLQNQ